MENPFERNFFLCSEKAIKSPMTSDQIWPSFIQSFYFVALFSLLLYLVLPVEKLSGFLEIWKARVLWIWVTYIGERNQIQDFILGARALQPPTPPSPDYTPGSWTHSVIYAVRLIIKCIYFSCIIQQHTCQPSSLFFHQVKNIAGTRKIV